MNDPLFVNKIFGAGLGSLTLVVAIVLGTHAITESHGIVDHHGELSLAYPIEFETEAAGGGEAEPEVPFETLLANAAPAAGERRAALCKSCHAFEEGGANGAGPALWDIVGRAVASVEGFNYSGALQEFGGEWTYERLNGYLENSQGYVPGTAMVQRFPKPEHRAEIIAYLRTLSDNPQPLPEAPQQDAAAGGDAGGDGGEPTLD